MSTHSEKKAATFGVDALRSRSSSTVSRRSSRLVKPRATYGVSGVSSVRSSHAPHEYS